MDLEYAKFDEETDPKTILNFDEVFIQEQLLGAGGFGTVYLLRGRYSKQPYAIKYVQNDPVKEVILLEKVSDYPDVPKYYDQFLVPHEDTTSETAILMEYIDGIDFEKIHTKKLKTFTVNEIYDLADYIFAFLSYIHGLGIAHGDISLKNIILASDGSVKFIDFGKGCLINDPDRILGCQLDDTDLDEGLEFHFDNIRPDDERLLDNLPLYFKTKDVHNASLLLYQLLTGQYPYQDVNERLAPVVPNIQTPNQRLNRVVNGTGVMDPFTRLTAEEALAELKQ